MSLDSAVHYEALDESIKTLGQGALKDSFFANGDDPQIVIYGEQSIKGRANGGQFIALSQLDIRGRVMRDVGQDIRKGKGTPGSVDDGIEVSYPKSGLLPESKPLVMVQNFFGVAPDRLNIPEDFRFPMRLWPDPKPRNYYETQESGNKKLVIRISGEKTEVRTRLLKRYLAARQLDAVLYVDSNAGIDYDGDLADLADFKEEAFSFESLTCLSRDVRRDRSQSGRIWMRLLAKRALKAPPREKYGMQPWDEIELGEYPESIIGENEFAEAVSWTCSSESLRNYYGKNPDTPYCCTPVYLKPEVSKRYYEDDGRKVRNGYLSCGNQWGVSIDNGCFSYVSVFLGDIGRDIPQSYWNHWKVYNTAPIGDMSEETIRCSFFNQSVKSRNPGHILKRVYVTLQEEWEEGWGWRLHRKAEGPDAGVLVRLHIPANESEAEFRAQLFNLALVLVDLLNEKCLIQGMDKVDNEKGTDKLSRFLESNKYEHVGCDISLLKKVQLIRSRLIAHSSGTKGRVCLEEELGDRSYREYLIDVIDQTTQILPDLKRFVASHASASGSQKQVIRHRALGVTIDSDGETDDGLSVGTTHGVPRVAPQQPNAQPSRFAGAPPSSKDSIEASAVSASSEMATVRAPTAFDAASRSPFTDSRASTWACDARTVTARNGVCGDTLAPDFTRRSAISVEDVARNTDGSS